MSDTNEEVLRRSLDAVDRHRNRLLLGLAAGIALLFFVFFRGAMAIHHGGNRNEALLAHYVLLVIWVTVLALAIVIQITVMTKRILRAIEVATKR
jgi:hypothetical protein